MARKRKALAHLDYYSAEYWNRLLSAEGLSMAALKSDRRHVSYVGTSNDLVNAEETVMRDSDGKVRPKDGTKPPPKPQRSLTEVIADLETDEKIAAALAALEAQNQASSKTKIIPAVDAPAGEKYFWELSLETQGLQAFLEKDAP